jgi:hypothetical protein
MNRMRARDLLLALFGPLLCGAGGWLCYVARDRAGARPISLFAVLIPARPFCWRPATFCWLFSVRCFAEPAAGCATWPAIEQALGQSLFSLFSSPGEPLSFSGVDDYANCLLLARVFPGQSQKEVGTTIATQSGKGG